MAKITRLFLLLISMSPVLAQDMTPIPNAEISRMNGASASLIAPTKRYNHAVLGDDIEAGGIKLTQNGKTYTYFLPENAVFEDRRARLTTLNNAHILNVLVIKSYLSKGAALALFKLKNGVLMPLAESEAIGSPNRWLNIIGVADFKGNGKKQIAAVITPHLVGSLRLYELNDAENKIIEIARLDGYTNHIIGEQNLDLARLVFGKEPIIVIPTLNRMALTKIRFDGKAWKEVTRVNLKQKIKKIISTSANIASVEYENGSRERINF